MDDFNNVNNDTQNEVPQGGAPLSSTPQSNNVLGKGQAIASLVLGIVSVVFWFFGVTAIGSVITGIIGVILASSSKKAGFNGGIRTAGFVCSLIGLIFGAIIFVACVACVGVAGSYGLFSKF